MKKLFFFGVLATLAMTVSGCSNDPEQVNSDIDDFDGGRIVEQPVEDALTETIPVPFFAFGDTFSPVAQAVVRRAENPLETVEGARVILLTAAHFSSLTEGSDEYTALKTAFDKGAIILLDIVTMNNMEKVADFTGWDDFASMEDDPTHPAYDLFGFNRDMDQYYLNDIFDEDGEKYTLATREAGAEEEPAGEDILDPDTERSLTPYIWGSYADAAARWIAVNVVAQPVPASVKRAIGAFGASSDLSSIMQAQDITVTCTVKAPANILNDTPAGSARDNLSKAQTIYTLSTHIYAAYSYTMNADYYLIDQVLWGNNSSFWIGNWDAKKDGAKWHWQGYHLYFLSAESRLTSGGWDNYLAQGAGLENFSPGTSNNTSSTSVSSSWSIGGSVGLSGLNPTASLTGGIGGSVSESFTSSDLSIKACCGDKDTNNNAYWEYRLSDYNFSHSDWTGFSFKSPCDLSVNAIKTAQCFLWRVDNPKQYKSISIRMDVVSGYEADLYRNRVFDGFTWYHSFKSWTPFLQPINPPKRD